MNCKKKKGSSADKSDLQISDEILEINGENVCEYDREEEQDDYDYEDDDLNEEDDEYNNKHKKNNANHNNSYNHSQIISYIHDVSNNFVLFII